MPELVADFNHVVRSSADALVATNQQEQREITAAEDFDVLGMGDTMGIPESQAKEIQMQARIANLEAREKRLQKRLTNAQQILRHSEQSCQHLMQQNDGLERENLDMNVLT